MSETSPSPLSMVWRVLAAAAVLYVVAYVVGCGFHAGFRG